MENISTIALKKNKYELLYRFQTLLTPWTVLPHWVLEKAAAVFSGCGGTPVDNVWRHPFMVQKPHQDCGLTWRSAMAPLN